MAPRGQTLPEATTESAREARKSFFCELCQKGYARMPEFEAHQSSYDHQHRQRMKDMRQMTKDPQAAAKARAAEQEALGIKSIDLSTLNQSTANDPAPSSAPKKKPVFKSTLQPHVAVALGKTSAQSDTEPQPSLNFNLEGATKYDEDDGDDGDADDDYEEGGVSRLSGRVRDVEMTGI